MSNNQQLVDVFPITTSAFGLRSDWLEVYSPKLISPAYLLMVLLLVISIGLMVLKRFENVDLEKKLWNIPFLVVVVAFWPFLILGLKDLVDTFNTFLVRDIFQIPWKGFGFPEMGSATNIFGWSAEGLARLLPNFSYWIIYAFYIIFFFFFAVLGPLVLVKGILFDEVEAFIELLREITSLLLWQTTVVILVAFIMPDIVSGEPFPPNPQANFYFLSLILGIMIIFAPSLTRKFASYLSSSFFPPGTAWMTGMLGITTVGRINSKSLYALGLTSSPARAWWPIWSQRFITAEMHNHDHRQGEEQKYRSRKVIGDKLYQYRKQQTESYVDRDSSQKKVYEQELKTPRIRTDATHESSMPRPPDDSGRTNIKRNEVYSDKNFSNLYKGKQSTLVEDLKKAKAEIDKEKSKNDESKKDEDQ